MAAPACDQEQPSVSIMGLSPPFFLGWGDDHSRGRASAPGGHDLSLLRLGDRRVVWSAPRRCDSGDHRPTGQPGPESRPVVGESPRAAWPWRVFAGGLNVTPGPACGPALPSECRLGAAVRFFLLSSCGPSAGPGLVLFFQVGFAR